MKSYGALIGASSPENTYDSPSVPHYRRRPENHLRSTEVQAYTAYPATAAFKKLEGPREHDSML